MSTPRTKPDPDKLAKLPKWALAYIDSLESERSVAINTLNEYCDNQTPSKCYAESYVCTGEEKGPTSKRAYFNAKQAITIVNAGVKLEVSFYEDDELRLRFTGENRMDDVAIMPVCHGQIRLVTKENLR